MMIFVAIAKEQVNKTLCCSNSRDNIFILPWQVGEVQFNLLVVQKIDVILNYKIVVSINFLFFQGKIDHGCLFNI